MPISKNSVQELSIEWLAIKGMATAYCMKCRKKQLSWHQGYRYY